MFKHKLAYECVCVCVYFVTNSSRCVLCTQIRLVSLRFAIEKLSHSLLLASACACARLPTHEKRYAFTLQTDMLLI